MHQFTQLISRGLCALVLLFSLSICSTVYGFQQTPVPSIQHDAVDVPNVPISSNLLTAPCSSPGSFDQMLPSSAAIASQEFEAANSDFDCQAADDFDLPVAANLVSIHVEGMFNFNGGTPPPSFNVFIYEDAGGSPGNQVYTENIANAGNTLSPTLDLGNCPLLPAGTYWVSVQARADFGTHGQWFWSTSTTGVSGPSLWQNPSNGFGNNCLTWMASTGCVSPNHVSNLFSINYCPATLSAGSINCRDANLSLDTAGLVHFTPADFIPGATNADVVDVVVSTFSDQRIYTQNGVAGDALVSFNVCAYLDRSLKVSFSNGTSNCWSTLTFKQSGGGSGQGRSKDVWCFDDLVEGGDIDGEGPVVSIPCGPQIELEFVSDWIDGFDCTVATPMNTPESDTAKIIYREYEGFYKGERFSIVDTITVFRLPAIIAGFSGENTYCAASDTTYCGEGFAGPFMIIPERCDPALFGMDQDGDGVPCDTIYFMKYDEETGQWVANELASKCGLNIHLDQTPFAAGSCETTTKFRLELKQNCYGAETGSICSMATSDNAFEYISPNPFTGLGEPLYLACEFWLTDLDTLGPGLDVVEPVLTLNSTDHGCEAHGYVSALQVMDEWSGVKQVKATIPLIGSVVMQLDDADGLHKATSGLKLPLKEGPYKVIYEAIDSCHNLSIDSSYIYVKDNIAPIAVSEKGVTVSLSDKKVWVDAETFDEGSWDNCGFEIMLARRTDWYTACVDLCDSSQVCWVTEHHDTLFIPVLESDKHQDEVEAHYAKTLDWLYHDGGVCYDILYNAWMYDLMKYTTIGCQTTDYDEHSDAFRKLVEETWSKGLFSKFKNNSYALASGPFSQFSKIDLYSRETESIGDIPGLITEIEFDAKSGRLFGTQGGGASQVFELDPMTGAVLSVMSHRFGAINGLEFINGVLYGTHIPFGGEPSILVALDADTGEFIEIGPTGYGPITGLAFDECEGVLYGMSNGDRYDEDGNYFFDDQQLLKIDLKTGLATAVGYTGVDKMGSIEFGADGKLYGGTTDISVDPFGLFELNLESGEAVNIGSTGLTLTGLTSTTFSTCPDTQLDLYEAIGGGWSDAVPFSCEDACGPVTVEILVMDYWCNWSKSWTEVWVEDKTPVKVEKDVLAEEDITCKTYKDARYSYPGEDHAVSLEYLVAQGEAGDSTALATLDGIWGGYCKAWVDPYGNYVDIDGNLIDCDLPFSDSICQCSTEKKQVRVYDDHLGYIWKDSVVTECYYEQDSLTFQKGIIAVNCAENVYCEQTVWSDFDACGQGYVFRKWKIWQGCPSYPADSLAHVPDTIIRTQRIWVGNECDLSKYMFDVPADTTIVSCAVEYDPAGSGKIIGAAGPESTGYATYKFDDDCRLVGIGYEDKVFKVVGGDLGCYKIQRTWYFADWCENGKSTQKRWWHQSGYLDKCVQTIVVQDTTAPVCLITGPVEDGGEVTSFSCDYDLSVEVSAGDACGVNSYQWDLSEWVDGSLVIYTSDAGSLESDTTEQFEITVEGLLPGDYQLRVVTTDDCNNENACEYNITIRGGKKPTPVCISSMTATLTPWDSDGDGEIDTASTVIWAEEFNSSSLAACADDSLAYRLEFVDGVGDTTWVDDADSLNLGCEDLGAHFVRMWVISYPSGTADYCDVVMVVQGDFIGCADISSNVEAGDMSQTRGAGQTAGDHSKELVDGDASDGEIPADASIAARGYETGFMLKQNQPNPFSTETTIGFILPDPTQATLTFYDVTGRVLKQIEGYYVKGLNEIKVEGFDLDHIGILYYQLDTDRHTATRKMLIVR